MSSLMLPDRKAKSAPVKTAPILPITPAKTTMLRTQKNACEPEDPRVLRAPTLRLRSSARRLLLYCTSMIPITRLGIVKARAMTFMLVAHPENSFITLTSSNLTTDACGSILCSILFSISLRPDTDVSGSPLTSEVLSNSTQILSWMLFSPSCSS